MNYILQTQPWLVTIWFPKKEEMAQIDKMETHVEKKSPANEFYEVFSSKAHLIPKACPDKIKSIEVVEGDWKSVGSVKLWTYCIGKATLTIIPMPPSIKQNNTLSTWTFLFLIIIAVEDNNNKTKGMTPSDTGASSY